MMYVLKWSLHLSQLGDKSLDEVDSSEQSSKIGVTGTDQVLGFSSSIVY